MLVIAVAGKVLEGDIGRCFAAAYAGTGPASKRPARPQCCEEQRGTRTNKR